MACEWTKLTSQDSGKPIYINLANAIAIENHKKGARIAFAEVTCCKIDVSETAEEILKQVGEIESANRT